MATLKSKSTKANSENRWLQGSELHRDLSYRNAGNDYLIGLGRLCKGQMVRAAIWIIIAVTFVAGDVSLAFAEKRVALVIGNSAYAHTTKLKNPHNDAKDMASALRRLGFDVIEGSDLEQTQMRQKVRSFASKIEGADVALFYYAGHGVQVAGNNYLAPVNARLSKESDLDFETISLKFILRQMEREQRINLVFLDACRDNPLSKKLARSMKTRSSNVGRGLAGIESGVGMLIAYATSPGDVAFDGDGRNSPYTTALLSHIERPGITINDMMIGVRQDVIDASKGKQVPWEHSSLTGRFFFKPEVKEKTAAAAEPTPKVDDKAATAISPQTVSNNLTRQTLVSSAYQATVAIGTCGAYKVFEDRHRGSFYGRLAEEWLKTNCRKAKRAVQVEAAESSPQTEAKPTVVAALKPTATPSTPVEEARKGTALVIALQKELGRLGCNPGRPDGSWGRKSQSALAKFDKFAKLNLSSDAPSATVLAALKEKTERVCPLQCGARYVAKGDRCVRKICSIGDVLNSAGRCVVRAKRQKRTKTVSKRVEPPAAKKPARKKKKTASKKVKPSAAKKRVKKRKAKKRVAKKTARRRASSKRRRRGPKVDRFRGGEDTRVDCQAGKWTGDCFPQRR